MRTYFIETWGCQMNHHDSEQLEGQLQRHGLVAASDVSRADLVLLNTCSVREKPVQKIVSRIGALSRVDRPPSIGICGCVAQQEREALLDQSAAVAFVLGPGQISRIGDAIAAVREGRRPVLTSFDRVGASKTPAPVVRRSPTRGMVTVIEGCEEYCTFCVVPYTRGREVSRTEADVLAEVERLARAGLHEVELLGQTINSYRCPTTNADFAHLLDQVARVPGLERVRYVTSHPRHFSDRIIDVLARHDNLSRYLHLPVQSGSDTILKRMHRRYTAQEYLDLIARIRSKLPDINLSTDLIVGFPGETEEDFSASLRLLEAVRFGQVFGFAFSPRPGTPAARYPDEIPELEKKRRLHNVFETSDRISLDLNQKLVGSTKSVLIDGDSRRSLSDWQGRAEDNRVVNFAKRGTGEIGDVARVRITRAGPHSLYGEMIGIRTRLPILDAYASAP
jgi:tRNA-2-methylthio-N6-dimethylallyladenosine synthase